MTDLHANVGDEIVVDSLVTGGPKREGEVLAVHRNGPVTYVVRWDDGHESVLLPGPDAHVVHLGRRAQKGPATSSTQ